MRRLGQVLIFVLVSCSWMACTEGDDPKPAADAGELPMEVRKVVGSAGGTLKAKGISLEIPEGALDKDVMILAKVSSDVMDLPAKVKRESELVEFGPAGTKFKKDVTVTFTLTKQEPRAVVYFTKEDSEDEFEALPNSKNRNLEVTATVKHFSRGFAGVPDEEEPGTDAGEDDGAVDAGVDATIDDAGSDASIDAGSDASDPDVVTVDSGVVDAISDAGEPSDAGSDAASDTGPVDAGPQLRTITLQSRDEWGNPTNQTWVAFQDDTNGPWQVITPSSVGSYSFQVAGARYGVVAVCANASNTSSAGRLIYALASSTSQQVTALGYCHSNLAPATFQLSGRIDAPGTASLLYYGHDFLAPANAGPASIADDDAGVPTYRIPDFRAGVTVDPVLAAATSDRTFLRARVLRGINLVSDTTLDVDLLTQGSPVGNAQVTITNATYDAGVGAYFVTRGADKGINLAQGLAFTEVQGTRQLDFATLDVTETVSTDRYRFVATDPGVTNDSYRSVEYRTQNPQNVRIALPDPFVATFGAETAPYYRPSVSFNSVTDASEYNLNVPYLAANGQQPHLFEAHIEAGYLPPGATHSFVYPDLSAVPGFNLGWMPPGDAIAVPLNAAVTIIPGLDDGELKQFSETYTTFPPPPG